MDAYTVVNKFFDKIQKAHNLDKQYELLKDIEENKEKRKELKTEIYKIFSDCIPFIQLTFRKDRETDDLVTYIAYVADLVGSGKVKAKLKDNNTKFHKVYKLNTKNGNFVIHLIKEEKAFMTGDKGEWLINPVSITRDTI